MLGAKEARRRPHPQPCGLRGWCANVPRVDWPASRKKAPTPTRVTMRYNYRAQQMMRVIRSEGGGALHSLVRNTGKLAMAGYGQQRCESQG